MSARKVYHVVPSQDQWKVKAENADKASNIFENKGDAVQRAKELAKAQSKGQVIIHKQDGTIQTEYTYNKDPFPPEG